MKRTLIITFSLLLVATTAFAFGWSDITGLVKGGSLAAIGLVISGLIVLFGLTARAKWLSGILLAIAALLHTAAAIPEYFGHALQDGKIDSDELKGVPQVFKSLTAQWKATLAMFKAKTDA